jgi:hypothetical protein
MADDLIQLLRETFTSNMLIQILARRQGRFATRGGRRGDRQPRTRTPSPALPATPPPDPRRRDGDDQNPQVLDEQTAFAQAVCH